MATPTAAHVARKLTRDAEQQKYSEIAVLVSVTVGREQLRNAEPRFHTAWVTSRSRTAACPRPLFPQQRTWLRPLVKSEKCHNRTHATAADTPSIRSPHRR